MRKWTALAVCLSLATACQQAAQQAGEPVISPPGTPDPILIHSDLKASFRSDSAFKYPADLRRAGRYGTVMVEYSVSDRGIPENLKAVEPSSGDFAPYGLRLTSKLHFSIPADWAEVSGPARRFKFQVSYCLTGMPCSLPPMGQDGFVITASNPK